MANLGLDPAARERIDIMRKLSPELADAFITGLEAGYNLAQTQGKEQKDER